MVQTDRLHSLDALRAYALLLGIVLHATISFAPGMLESGFPVADNSPSSTLARLFYVIHVFRMSTFYLVAGIFARMALQRKGLGGFIKDRAKRIGLPLLVAWPVCIVSVVAVIIWAYYVKNGGQLPANAQPSSSVGFTFIHLWFLWYLLWMYLVVLGVRALLERVDPEGKVRGAIDRVVAATVNNHLAPFLLAVPVGLAMIALDNWIIWTGIPSPDKSIIPEWQPLVAYGVPFCFGWLLHRQMGLLRTWERAWPANLVIGIATTVVCFLILRSYRPSEFARADWSTVAYSFSYAVAALTLTAAMVGLAMRYFADESPVRRYLADSSYWLYLTHVPLVFALQAVVMNWNLHWSIKFPVILLTTYGLLMIAYHYLVRSTFIGATLNGKKYPRTKVSIMAETKAVARANSN